jgi:hypothetical protein
VLGGNHPALVPSNSQNNAGDNTRHKIQHQACRNNREGYEKAMMQTEKRLKKDQPEDRLMEMPRTWVAPLKRGWRIVLLCYIELHDPTNSKPWFLNPRTPNSPLGVGLARI